MDSTFGGMKRHTEKKNNIEIWISDHKIHLISWSVFIFWESIIIGLIYGVFGKFFNYAIHYSINILLFYIHTWLIEKALVVKRSIIWRTPLFFIAEVIGYIILVFYVDNLLASHTNLLSGELETNKKRILMLFWRSLYFIFFSTGYFFLKRYTEERNVREEAERLSSEISLEKQEIENALINAKNSFLKAQINPHLLFNTFEFLHNRMKTIAPEESKLMVYLSEIVRFAATTKFHEGSVKLGDEIMQCENLIKIYCITQQKVFIKISYSENVYELRFIPLVVITLLENILKHGDIFDSTKYSGIDLYIDGEIFKIESFNFFLSNKNNNGFGSGLKNIRSRLFYAYGDPASMTISEHQNIYRVELSIPLKLLSTGRP